MAWMTEADAEALSPAEIAAIDAQYEPFPAFADWPHDLADAGPWQRAGDELKRTAEAVSDDDLKRAQTIAQRAAAFDTGAIEGLYATDRGLTFTVAEQAAHWEEEARDRGGSNALALFEAQLDAFELVLDHVTDRLPTLTQAWLRRLHEEIVAPQETYVVHTAVGPREQQLPRGEYKKYPNHVRVESGEIHAYAPVEATQSEMQRFVEELETDDFGGAHPIIQASYVHYCLVAVHPFADGNGRVARAAASVYTYRAATVPLLVFDDQRSEYFNALAEADRGNIRPFVEFVMRAGISAIRLVNDHLHTTLSPDPSEILGKFQALYDAHEQHEELDRLGLSFADWIAEIATAQISALETSRNNVTIEVEKLPDSNGEPPGGFRKIRPAGSKSVRFQFKAGAPASASLPRRFNVFVSNEPESFESLILQGVQMQDESLVFERSDLRPRISGVAQRRVENLVKRALGNGLAELREVVGTELGSP
jgi:Fic family protein